MDILHASSELDARRRVAAWLLMCCALLFTMVVVGGITRLTHSGLSIVEWQPIVGALPPLSEQAWHETFQKYQQTPEYQQVNSGMRLAEFKGIFWWEYAHRLLGRAIGLVFLLPLIYFLVRRRLAPGLPLKLAGIFLLGALQGFMGWYMVASGLVDDPRVSHYRLTAHLALAFVIYGAMLWVALGLLNPQPAGEWNGGLRGLRRFAWGITALVLLMMVTGGFVAGIRAGFAYNTFPLMNGHLVPPEIFMIDPWWRNFFNNMATVQFNHRLIAWALAFAAPALWVMAVRGAAPFQVKLLAHLLLAASAVQIALGIATLVLVVPVALAAAHQGGALAVFTAALALNHALRPPAGRRPVAVTCESA